MKSLRILIFIFTLMTSCNQESKSVKKNKTSSEMIGGINLEDLQEMEKYKTEVMQSGDISSYLHLQQFFVDRLRFEELLFCSLIMANKYNYRPAYFNVFMCLKFTDKNGEFEKLDDVTKSLAMYYLLRSYELGDSGAIYDIRSIIGEKSKIPKSAEYLH